MGRGIRTLLAFLGGLLVGGAVVYLLGDALQADGPEARRGTPRSASEGAAASEEAAASGPAGARPTTHRGGLGAGSADADLEAAASLEGLGPTEEERAFLRRALAEERARRREAVVRTADSGLDVLRRRLEHGADLSALVADYDAFASHVRAPEGPSFDVVSDGDVTRVTKEMVPPGTTVIRFGPGTFEVPALEVFTALRDREKPVPGLEIRGAGMDRTTLIGLAAWQVGGRVEHLVLRDFTWVSGDGASLMLSVHGSVGARIENVRIQGWRSGGHSAALGASGPSYLALRGCELLGKRRGKNDGGLGLSLRDDCIVLLQDCLFADLENGALSGWKGNGARAGVWVRDCTFENARLAAYGGNDENWLHVHARGGKAAYGPATWTAEERRRWWFHGVDGSVEGVTLGPGIARCTTADLARALARYEVPADHRVLGIELTEFDRGGPLAFRIYVSGATAWPQLRIAVRMDEAEAQRGDREGSFPHVTGDTLAEVLPIRTLLERIDAPDGVTVSRFVYGTTGLSDRPGLVPAIQIGLPWDHWIYDARTGALLEHRSWRR